MTLFDTLIAFISSLFEGNLSYKIQVKKKHSFKQINQRLVHFLMLWDSKFDFATCHLFHFSAMISSLIWSSTEQITLYRHFSGAAATATANNSLITQFYLVIIFFLFLLSFGAAQKQFWCIHKHTPNNSNKVNAKQSHLILSFVNEPYQKTRLHKSLIVVYILA